MFSVKLGGLKRALPKAEPGCEEAELLRSVCCKTQLVSVMGDVWESPSQSLSVLPQRTMLSV